MAPSSQPNRYSVNSVATGLRLLDTLADTPQQSLKQLAQRLELTSSQTFRILATLEEAGYVVKSQHKTYTLGYKCLVLGQAASHEISLVQLAGPYMDQLAQKTSENIHLVKRDGIERVIVDLRDSPHRIRMISPVGHRHPLYIGGTGLTILAFSPPDVVEQVLVGPFKRFAARTVESAQELSVILDRIRRDGFHVALEDFENGAFSVAAPIFNADGTVDSSVCISGPTMRFSLSKEREYQQLVCVAAADISRALGHR